MRSEVQILPGPPPLLASGKQRGDSGLRSKLRKPIVQLPRPLSALLRNACRGDGCCAAIGGVAQLGEHLLCKQGVVGSSPITSTTSVVWMIGRVSRRSDKQSALMVLPL